MDIAEIINNHFEDDNIKTIVGFFEQLLFLEASSKNAASFEIHVVEGWNDWKKFEARRNVSAVRKKEVKIVIEDLVKFGISKSEKARKIGKIRPIDDWSGKKIQKGKFKGQSVKDNPKTDIVIGSNKISLKYGPSQLSSSSLTDVKAIFEAIIMNGSPWKEKLKKLSKTMEKHFVEKIQLTQSVTDIKKNNRNSKEKKLVDEYNELHRQATEEFKKVFDIPQIGEDIVYEMLSGKLKFGNTDGSANLLVAFSPTNQTTKINKIDRKYAKKVYNISKPIINFKSNSNRIGYRAFSVLRMGTEKIHKYDSENIINDNIANLLKDDFILYDEDFIDYINKFRNSITGFFTNIRNKTVDFLYNTLNTLFGIEIEVTIPDKKIDFTKI